MKKRQTLDKRNDLKDQLEKWTQSEESFTEPEKLEKSKRMAMFLFKFQSPLHAHFTMRFDSFFCPSASPLLLLLFDTCADCCLLICHCFMLSIETPYATKVEGEQWQKKREEQKMRRRKETQNETILSKRVCKRIF